MIRTKEPTNYSNLLTQMATRMALAQSMAQQSYGGDRNLFQALGYLDHPTYDTYLARYKRQDIAKAIIDRPVVATWRGDLRLLETDDETETALEKEFTGLEKTLGVKSMFVRLDKLVGIGEYGVLLFGFNDVVKLSDFASPVLGTKKDLLYLKPYGQGSAEISSYIKDPTSPDFGKPEIYNITMANPGEGSGAEVTVPVHYSRVLHVAADLLEDEILGTPRMQAVLNRLFDIEKIVGGDGEMFWRGARPGYSGKVDPDFTMTPQTTTDLQDQINEYENNLRRMLVTTGVSFESLAQQVSDPANHLDVQIQMISAETGIPKRILTGSERGELSSSQDQNEWYTFVQTRREEYAENAIVRPFVDKCTEVGILPAVEDFTVDWSNLFALSEKEQVEIGKVRATALKDYGASPMAEYLMPPAAFLKYGLGLTDDDVDFIQEVRDAEQVEEMREERQALADEIALGGIRDDGSSNDDDDEEDDE